MILEQRFLLVTDFLNMASVFTGFQELSKTTKCADNAEKIFFCSVTFTNGTPGKKHTTSFVAKLQFSFW